MEWMKLAIAVDDIGQAPKVENLAWSEGVGRDGELIGEANTAVWSGATCSSDGIDRESGGLGKAPKPQAEVAAESDSAGFLLRGYARAYLMGIAPKPPGNPRGVGRGIFFIREPLDPRLNIPIC